MSSWMRSLSSSVLSTSTRKTMELGDVIARLEAVVNHLVTTKVTVRLSRNRNSEHLPQRRKGCKVRRLRLKIIYKSFCPFPISLAPLRLGGRNSRLRVLSMLDYLRRPRKFLTIVIRSTRRYWISRLLNFVLFMTFVVRP